MKCDSYASLKVIIDHSTVPQFAIDKDHKVIFWNRALEIYSGIKAGEVLGTDEHWRAFYDRKRPCMADLLVDQALGELPKWYGGLYSKSRFFEEAYEATDCTRASDGREVWFHFSAAVIRDSSGEIAGAVETCEDVTNLKQAEKALRESEEKFRVLADTSPAAIIVYQGEDVKYANYAATMLTQYSREELLTKKFWELVHPDYADIVRERGLARQRGETVPAVYEIRSVNKSGEEHWDLMYAGTIEYGGKPAVIVTVLNITDRKLAEKEVEDAKNQAELFLDLMGHDISNMNQIGVGYLEMAQEVMSHDETTRELISRPLETLYDSSRLIADVNKLQRITAGEVRLEKTDVGEKLREVVEAYKGKPGFKSELRHSQLSECLVMANELLYDVFANLLWDCMKNATEENIVSICQSGATVSGRPCCTVIVDSPGTGMSDEQKARLFSKPMKGMKRTGGRGIGLYLVKCIVERFEGTLQVEDLQPGDCRKGIRYTISLPACR